MQPTSLVFSICCLIESNRVLISLIFALPSAVLADGHVIQSSSWARHVFSCASRLGGGRGLGYRSSSLRRICAAGESRLSSPSEL
jgi:hypothetical protein